MHRFSFIISELLVSPYLTLYKPETSLRRTVGVGPEGVRLREREEGLLAAFMTGRSDVIFGLRIYTLGIFWGGQETVSLFFKSSKKSV